MGLTVKDTLDKIGDLKGAAQLHVESGYGPVGVRGSKAMSEQHVTESDIAELERLHVAGTPEPWTLDFSPVDNLATYSIDSPRGMVCMQQEADPGDFDKVARAKIEADFRLAVGARNALPKLIAEIQRLWAGE